MQFIDLSIQQERIRDNIEANIRKVLDHGKYIMGSEVKALEDRLAAYVGSKYAIGCASGTDALLLSLLAYGVGPGDAVFTTPFTFISTAEVISLLGATPVFVDIDPLTFNINPSQLAEAVLALTTNDLTLYPLPGSSQQLDRTRLIPRGIIAVDLFGLPADYDAIREIAEQHGLFIIQDAAQSFGAEYKGQRTCKQGDIGCTSFFPAKPLGCYGDGGMCFTDDDALARNLRSICVHGKGAHKYDNVRIGINGRLDTIQAAILLAKFEIFEEEIDLRQSVAQRYSRLLYDIHTLTLPRIPEGYKSVWAQLPVLARDSRHRKAIQHALKEAAIPTAIYYPVPLHLQRAFDYLGLQEGVFPVSEALAQRIFSLPMHPYLTKSQQESIAGCLLEMVL